jgi:hypothetical protein
VSKSATVQWMRQGSWISLSWAFLSFLELSWAEGE